MQPFEYANAASVKEAVSLLASKNGNAHVLAGGTDIISMMKDYLVAPALLVNVKNIKDLGGIKASKGELRIGAVVTFEELTENAEVRRNYASLADAARGLGSPQIRNMGTVGGDLCQRPRCWYYRGGFGLLAKDAKGNALVPKGENRYHAILGNSGPAYFVSPSSLGPALIALNAKIRLVSAAGTRDVEAAKFFLTPSSDTQRETDVKPGELLTEILIPAAAGMRTATYEVRQKEALDWPLAAASVALKMNGSSVSEARVVLGAVAPTPWAASAANQFLAGKTITAETAEAAGKAAVEGAKPLSQNAYKVQLAKVAVKRALMQAAGVKA